MPAKTKKELPPQPAPSLCDLIETGFTLACGVLEKHHIEELTRRDRWVRAFLHWAMASKRKSLGLYGSAAAHIYKGLRQEKEISKKVCAWVSDMQGKDQDAAIKAARSMLGLFLDYTGKIRDRISNNKAYLITDVFFKAADLLKDPAAVKTHHRLLETFNIGGSQIRSLKSATQDFDILCKMSHQMIQGQTDGANGPLYKMFSGLWLDLDARDKETQFRAAAQAIEVLEQYLAAPKKMHRMLMALS